MNPDNTLTWKTIWNSQKRKKKKVLEPNCNEICTALDHIQSLLVNLPIIFSLSNFSLWHIRKIGRQAWWKLQWWPATQEISQKNRFITQLHITEVPNNDPESLRKSSTYYCYMFFKSREYQKYNNNKIKAENMVSSSKTYYLFQKLWWNKILIVKNLSLLLEGKKLFVTHSKGQWITKAEKTF